MNIYLSSRARRDLQRAFDYIAIDNPFAARRVQDDIIEAVQSLAQFPERG